MDKISRYLTYYQNSLARKENALLRQELDALLLGFNENGTPRDDQAECFLRWATLVKQNNIVRRREDIEKRLESGYLMTGRWNVEMTETSKRVLRSRLEYYSNNYHADGRPKD